MAHFDITGLRGNRATPAQIPTPWAPAVRATLARHILTCCRGSAVRARGFSPATAFYSTTTLTRR